MKKFSPLILVTATLLILSCSGNKHFISDSEYRALVNKQFENRHQLFHSREKQLFSVLDQKLSLQQQEALKFLFAYMPLSDLADYDGEYYLQQVNYSFMARDTFSWGKTIPEDIFRHFVLPIRVNNENLDTARPVFFRELKDRIKNMTIHDAALEVNHWCHEKVNYRPSDSRTSSPLASVRTSFGRCGEESTFTVAAMRSVGIPARQVYTPRWAHTDDNHAWVEVYVDGRWQYLGACEPEAVLNKGWFDVPVKRAMMVHTNVIGEYDANENVIEKNALYTKINSLSSYTATKQLVVKVLNNSGLPVQDARVAFGIYNYAEFYPMVVKQTDKQGLADLLTGLGDLQVWASKDDMYGYNVVSVGVTDTLTITLARKAGEEYVEKTNIIPPVEKSVPSVSVATQKENDLRLALEDSIRDAYMATFMKPGEAEALALELKLDTAQVKRFIALSYGNWSEIKSYLTENAANPHVLDLLNSIAEKDIRDIPANYLKDHLINTVSTSSYPKEIFNEGILSARVLNEGIKPWRLFLKSKFKGKFDSNAIEDLNKITKWVNDSIAINTTDNYMGCPITPIGVYELRIADKRSRDIFFVALCRSLGIPAKIDQATLLPKVYTANKWSNISFEKEEPKIESALLILNNSDSNLLKPEYYIHYTLQKFDNGKFVTLDYEGSSLVNEFPVKLHLEPGYYLLMTGNRRDDGSVVSRADYFNLNNGDSIVRSVILEPLKQETTIVGLLDLKHSVSVKGSQSSALQDYTGEKGMILAFINPGNEPTRHIMNDIPLLKIDFDKWGGNFLFMVPSSLSIKDFDGRNYKNMPVNCKFLLDEKDELLKYALKATGKSTAPLLPLVMFVNNKGEVTFLSSGYRIGIGENLLKALKKD